MFQERKLKVKVSSIHLMIAEKELAEERVCKSTVEKKPYW